MNENLRIFLAYLVIPGLPIAMIVAGVILVSGGRGKSSWRGTTGRFILSIPIGLGVYAFVGIATARVRGEGHFYSVPFGAYRVDDAALVASMVLWIAFVFLGLSALSRLKRG